MNIVQVLWKKRRGHCQDLTTLTGIDTSEP